MLYNIVIKSFEIEEYIIIDLKSCKEFRVKDVVGDNEFECMERYGGVFYTFKRDEIKLVSKQ